MIFRLIFLLLVAVFTTSCQDAPWQEGSLRDIEPRGWLLEKLQLQRDGLTGHPEALSYPYNTCLWAGEIPRQGTHGQDWWRYEQTAYYTDGLLRLGYLLDDRDFIGKGEAGIAYTLAHPRENGRLGSAVISNTWPFAVSADAVPGFADGKMTLTVRPVEWDFDRGPEGQALTPDLPKNPVPAGPEQTITLTPYGGTTLRLTVFPVLNESCCN